MRLLHSAWIWHIEKDWKFRIRWNFRICLIYFSIIYSSFPTFLFSSFPSFLPQVFLFQARNTKINKVQFLPWGVQILMGKHCVGRSPQPPMHLWGIVMYIHRGDQSHDRGKYSGVEATKDTWGAKGGFLEELTHVLGHNGRMEKGNMQGQEWKDTVNRIRQILVCGSGWFM